MNPKVFICHASEDKEKFVLEFARKLRENGVDAWVDVWEMLPGDSLIDKIFEEGIKNAQAIIVILSNYSVKKAWVKEELNASIVKKINEKCKLIPILIDDCEIPESLKSTVWERISDVNNYENEFKRILSSIYGQYDKPPIGKQPKYVNTIVNVLPNLSKLDNVVFNLACSKIVKDDYNQISAEDLFQSISNVGYSREDFYETLEILDSRGYIKALKVLDGNIPSFTITMYGFEKYLRAKLEDYDFLVNNVAFIIVNKKALDNQTIIAELGKPQLIIDHILNVLDNKGLIKLQRTIGGLSFISNISPELKRKLRNK
ncbi:MAG: toll/interleukin-1 receptor domain-containing protein [bacterium]